jgi:hypothetical protein
MRPTSIGGVLLLILVTHTAPCLAEVNAWTGTWHLNETKSQPLGPSFAELVTPQGEYQMNNGRFSYSFRCDGKEYSTGADRSIVCLQGTSSATDTVLKIHGRVITQNHTEVSPDNKRLTVTTKPAGTSVAKTHIFERVSGSTGLSGSWQDMNDSYRTPKVIVTTLSASVFRLDFPLVKQDTEMNLDGADAPMHGASQEERVTLSARQDGQSRLFILQKIDGVAASEGFLILSQDGRSLIQETWRPGHPNERLRLVYDKQ